MEIGPRALGHRSILARPDDRAIKDRLNLLLKKRVWYQPFCPSMLIEDAPALLETEGQEIRDNRFMTMGFRVRPERLPLMEGVINVDGTCRPQFVGDEEPRYRDLLLGTERGAGIRRRPEHEFQSARGTDGLRTRRGARHAQTDGDPLSLHGGCAR